MKTKNQELTQKILNIISTYIGGNGYITNPDFINEITEQIEDCFFDKEVEYTELLGANLFTCLIEGKRIYLVTKDVPSLGNSEEYKIIPSKAIIFPEDGEIKARKDRKVIPFKIKTPDFTRSFRSVTRNEKSIILEYLMNYLDNDENSSE